MDKSLRSRRLMESREGHGGMGRAVGMPGACREQACCVGVGAADWHVDGGAHSAEPRAQMHDLAFPSSDHFTTVKGGIF